MPKSIKRTINFTLAFLLIATTVLVIAGCGGKDETASGKPAAEEVDAGALDNSGAGGTDTSTVAGPVEANAPAKPVRLVFIHHSVGENWLADDGGGLGLALMRNNYYVSDTNYGWGPDGIGDTTDIGDWYTWFAGPGSETYTSALFSEDQQNSSYTRLDENPDPGGENEIIMFKSCYPNSGLGGAPGQEAVTGNNPLRGHDSGSEYQTVGNAKGIYNDLLDYFATRQDKLFIVVTAPPMSAEETDADTAANARAFNTWLVEDWLSDYPYDNVAVFDFYNVLTSNGGDREVNDAGAEAGNHHRYINGSVEYTTDQGTDLSAYDSWGDSHPTPAGGSKATEEFIGLLNYWYGRWAGS